MHYACSRRDNVSVADTALNHSLTRPHGDGLLVAGLSPQLGEDPPVEDPGLCDPLEEPGWLSWVVSRWSVSS